MAKNAETTTEVATKESFSLMPVYAGMDDEVKAELDDEMDDLDDEGGIFCRRIKMPTGKSKAFEVESDNPDDPDMEKELHGVILFSHKMNTRWEGEFGGENRMPVCSSWDAKNGVLFETGEAKSCDKCPFNNFKEDGTGKDCKNMRRIYLMLDGKPHLYLLTVPPTSLKAVSTQLKRIMSNGTPFTRIVCAFQLEGAVSKGGKDYAKITVKKIADLTPEQAKLAYEMRENIKKQYQNVGIDNDDYNTGAADQAASAPATDADGFVNVPENIDEELPFN